MKRVGSIQAAVSVLLPAEDIRPPQGISPQLVNDGIDSRYGFQVKPPGVGTRNQLTLGASPALGGTFTAGGMLPVIGGVGGLASFGIGGIGAAAPTMISSFRNGNLTAGQHSYAVQQLDLNFAADPGNVTVQMNTTEAGDIILNDVFDILTTAFGFRNLMVLDRQYVSNVVVEFDHPIDGRFKELAAIQDILNRALRTPPSERYGIERLSFGVDATTIPATKAQNRQSFILERRANHNFSENRYFSAAPMKTEDHFQALEDIAALVEGQKT